ncbi:MAG: queuosine precursor transporter [Deltaproteobacteria bacterium]|nr:queuosine precursor transporter [Deltaproteobacteria bacterium]
MNELILLFQIATIIGSCFLAARISKEALVTLVCLQAVMANFLVLKQIDLFGLQVTCSDAFAVGSILSLNLLQEEFGRDIAQKSTWICFGSMLFFALSSQLHLAYIPSAADSTHSYYQALLSPSPRLFCASIASFLIVQQFDVLLYDFLKKRLPQWHFGSRSTLSLMASQALDTFLFTTLGLWGLVDSLPEVFIFSYLVKVLIISAIWIPARQTL